MVVAGFIIAILLSLGGLVTWYLMSFPTTHPGAPEPIDVGNLLYEYSGLVFIAHDQGFFSRNGLNVTLHDYVSTVASIEEMENNETDITLAPEYSIVREAFNNENISIIGNIDKYQSVFLICRNDRGIEDVSDLKGKKIGASRGTIGEFYLGRFLNLRGLHVEDVTLVDMPTSQYVDAITNGSVDGVVAVFKYLDQSKERLGNNVIAWPIQNSQKGYVVLACRNDWAASHPATISKFLESLKQAEEYSITHPAETKSIIQKRMNYSDATMVAVWPDHQYSLTLDHSLVLAMEDEGRWMINNNLTDKIVIPDFRKYINITGLEKVNPEAVNIIG